MDASALIGNAQTALAAGLQKQAANAIASQVPGRGPMLHPVDQKKKAREAAQQFEGFFVGQMMEQMMSGIDADPMFGGGSAEETWRSMLNQEYGKQVAKSNKLGISDMVMKAMLKAQEERTAAATGQPAPIHTRDETIATQTTDASAAATAMAPFRPIKR